MSELPNSGTFYLPRAALLNQLLLFNHILKLSFSQKYLNFNLDYIVVAVSIVVLLV